MGKVASNGAHFFILKIFSTRKNRENSGVRGSPTTMTLTFTFLSLISSFIFLIF